MANVPLDTRFVGFSDKANLTERKTDYLNSISQPYTMQDIANSAGGGTTYVDIPYEWYPYAGLQNAGPKFTYTDGVNLISYHIKGVDQINEYGNNIYYYICSVKFPDGEPFMMPGSVSGSIQINVNGDIISTPLANGAVVGLDSGTTTISDLKMYLYPYENPQPDGSFIYALVMTANTADSGAISGLFAYDFEFLLDDNVNPPTIFQD